jgi:hypothetical protein
MRLVRLAMMAWVVAAIAAWPPAQARAQGEPRSAHGAQPERPTVATHAGTVAPGWLEIESGIELDHGSDPDHVGLGLFLIKLGMDERLQLSIFGSVVRPSGNPGGMGDFGVGVKWRILENHPWLGDFALLPSLTFPTGIVKRGTGSGVTSASLLLISSRDAGPVHIDLNAGYSFRGGSGARAPRDAWVWTASFGGTVVGRLGWTAELFGVPGTGGPQGGPPLVGFLAGPVLTIREWLVLDAGGIAPVTGGQSHAFYAGAVCNIGRLWRPPTP